MESENHNFHNDTLSGNFRRLEDWLADPTNPIIYCLLSLDGKKFLTKNSYKTKLHQKTNKQDRFSIAVPNDAIDEFKEYVMHKSQYLLGKEITITYHQYGKIQQSFYGIIDDVKDKRNGTGYGETVLKGRSPAKLLDNGKKHRSFTDKTLRQIVEKINENQQSSAKVHVCNWHNAKEKILPFVVQYNESDYEFLQRLAKFHGEYFYYNGEKLIFGNDMQPDVKIGEGKDLDALDLRIQLKPQFFSYKSYDDASAENIDKSADSFGRNSFQNKGNMMQVVALNQSERVFTEKPKAYFNNIGAGTRTSNELEDAVKKEREKRQNVMTVKGTSRNPALRAGGCAEMSDINGKAMETYRILEIKHFYEPGDYYNEFVGIPDLYQAPYQDNDAFPKAKEQSAKVIDNNDPEARGRVQVQFPWQEYDNEKTPWIRLNTLHAGAGKGTNFIPEIGEEVWVGFENGNAERPIVLGTLYNGKEKSGYHTAGNDLKVIQTRSGCKIVINDEKGSILFQDANGSQVFLDGQGNIDLMSSKKINLDSKEINLRAEKIKLESSEVMDIKSYQSAKITSFQTMNIDSTKSLKVNSTNMSMNAKESFKTTAQNVDLGAEKQMKVSSQAMEVHGTDTMDLKSPALNKVTQAEKVSASTGDEKGVQAIALIKPSTTYKGEFGIDYCEMDDKFEKIESFQGTKVSDVEYIFDKANSQYRKGGTDAEKQNLIKEMYYSKTYFGKNYLATWMNIKEGITAKVKLTTFFIDKSKKPDSEKEFISFKENPNFEITYDSQKNNAIKIKVKDHKKEYSVEIKAIKSFETTEYIDIVDEEGNEVGIIEMAPNKVEELEIKIIPVILKTLTPALQDTQAEAIYNKAMTAKNADGKNLTDTLTQFSLNQAGIKGKLIANPKGAEKIIINVTNEYKNYWDASGKFLKDWTLTDDERDESKNAGKKPDVWVDEDGTERFKNYQTETIENGGVKTQKQMLKDEKRFLLDKLEEEYYKLYGRNLKGALVFVTDLDYDPKEGAGAYSQNVPIKNQGVIVFKNRLENSPTYIHEIGHMLGLEHTFFKDEGEMKQTNKQIKEINDFINNEKKNIEEENKLAIESREKRIKRNDNDIIESNGAIANEEKQGKNKSQNFINTQRELIKDAEDENIKLKVEVEDIKNGKYENKNIKEYKKRISDYELSLSIYKSLTFRVKQASSKNYMDYIEDKLYFLKKQCQIINNESKSYYK